MFALSEKARCWLVVLITPVCFVAVFVGFWLTGSWSLLSDDFHVLGDGIPFMLIILLSGPNKALWQKRITFANVCMMEIFGAWALLEGARAIITPQDIPPVMVWFAGIDFCANVVQLTLTWKMRGHLGDSYRSTIVHLAVDVFGSALVVVSGMLIYGWSLNIDGWFSVFVGTLTCIAGWHCWSHHKKHEQEHEACGHDHDHKHGHSHGKRVKI